MTFQTYKFRTISSLPFFRLQWLVEERKEAIHNHTGDGPRKATVILRSWDQGNTVTPKETQFLLSQCMLEHLPWSYTYSKGFMKAYCPFWKGSYWLQWPLDLLHRRWPQGRWRYIHPCGPWASVRPASTRLERCWAFTLTLAEKIHPRNLL